MTELLIGPAEVAIHRLDADPRVRARCLRAHIIRRAIEIELGRQVIARRRAAVRGLGWRGEGA